MDGSHMYNSILQIKPSARNGDMTRKHTVTFVTLQRVLNYSMLNYMSDYTVLINGIMFSRVFALGCSLVSNKFIVRHLVVNAKVRYARFHLSPSRKLINPLLWKILQPISRVGAAVFGR